MIGQVLVGGKPGWWCWACGGQWQIPPHNDVRDYQAAQQEWLRAHKGCTDPAPAPVAGQRTMMDEMK